MERITRIYPNGNWGIKGGIDDAVKRLAAYEDTGLEPEEIERILDEYGRGLTLRASAGERLEIVRDIPLDRLRELAEAALKEREKE